MMSRHNNQAGFGVIEVAIVVAVVAILGFGGWLVMSHKKKAVDTTTSSQMTPTTKQTTTSNTQMTPTVTSDELIAVAKKVYLQVPADGLNPPTVGGCGGHINSCPFTTALTSKIDNASTPTGSAVLNAGIQNGPFGTLTYNAAPATQGGIVTVNLSPDTSAGGPEITWKLTMVQNDNQLLVNDIQYSRGAYGNNSACGPVEIYDYPSCTQ